MPDYAKHALQCAQRFSCCDVVALSDMEEEGWGSYLSLLSEDWKQFWPDLAGAVKRWVVMLAYIQAHGLGGPIVNCDWDLLVFDDLVKHFTKLRHLHYSYGHCVDRSLPNGLTSAPYVVTEPGCIRAYCDTVLAMCRYGGACHRIKWADMSWWNVLRKYADTWTIFNAGQEVGGGLFDPNINLDLDLYEQEDGRKRVVFQDRKPHFVRKDGTMIRAVAVHCFMAMKERTGELMSQL